MSRLLMLLQLALIGCREAAYSRDLERAAGEFKLACASRAAISKACNEQFVTLQQAIEEYASYDNKIMSSRAEMYEGLGESIDSAKLETHGLVGLVGFTSVFAVIDEGLISIGKAIAESDLERCEIEADHIHNLPSLIDNTRELSFDYYLDKERSRFLSRLEKKFGADASRVAAKSFDEHWNAMSNIN